MSSNHFLPSNLHLLRVNSERLKSDYVSLSHIGETSDDGVDRPAFSEAHLATREWFKERIRSAGFDFRVDGAGNHSAYYPCGRDKAPTLLLGSHLDSVQHGGKFDGTLGVLAGLECLRVIKENNLSLPVNLEAIDFTDEEGTYIGLLGSSALAGKMTAEELDKPRQSHQELMEAFKRAGISKESILNVARDHDSFAGYLELHIEQGSRLMNRGIDIGIVSAIVAISSFKLTFIGKADHAGTTSMLDRLDASQGASAFTLAVRKLILSQFSDCVANIGNMHFSPGAFNIVPEQVECSLELRAADSSTFEELENALIKQAQKEAHRFNLKLKIQHLGKHYPALMNSNVQESIAKAARIMGLSNITLHSGAGHDAQSMSSICPAGMLFVPSIDGASHSAHEFTRWRDCVNGANVLLQACLIMAYNLSNNL